MAKTPTQVSAKHTFEAVMPPNRIKEPFNQCSMACRRLFRGFFS